MDIRECRTEDLDRLEEWMPSGLTRIHAQRFGRQEKGLSTFLVALRDASLVGSGEIRWDGCTAPELRQLFPDCPELNGLQVWPAHLQSQGIGTAIIGRAEQVARRRGCNHLGLGVAEGNERAAALYLRLGYTETECHYLDRYHYITDDGARHEVADPARFFIKRL